MHYFDSCCLNLLWFCCYSLQHSIYQYLFVYRCFPKEKISNAIICFHFGSSPIMISLIAYTHRKYWLVHKQIFEWVQYMHHSGRLSSDDDKQQYILIDEEDITADVGEQQPPRSSMQRGNEHQLTAHELTFRKKNIDSFKFALSKVSDEGWLIKRAFTSERRNKTTGKLEL